MGFFPGFSGPIGFDPSTGNAVPAGGQIGPWLSADANAWVPPAGAQWISAPYVYPLFAVWGIMYQFGIPFSVLDRPDTGPHGNFWITNPADPAHMKVFNFKGELIWEKPAA